MEWDMREFTPSFVFLLIKNKVIRAYEKLQLFSIELI